MVKGNEESTDNAQIDADIIPIRTAVTGYVKSIHFKDNQLVKKGDLLVTIDDVEYQTRVAQAKAALENAKSNLLAVKSTAIASKQNVNASFFSAESSQSSVVSAQAKLNKVKEDFNRIEKMYQSKAATKSEYDNVTAELQVAQAQVESANKLEQASRSQSAGLQSQSQSQQAMIALAEAMVRQREAELKLAQTQLDYTTIEAPCDGIVSKRTIESGQFITLGSPLCSEINNSDMWISANFKETQVEKMKVGQHVTIKIDAYPSIRLTGIVNSFIGATGAKFSLLPPDNATGNFVKIVQRVPVKITFDAKSKALVNKLFPGLSAFVSVKIN
jgi:membrane fusion protein (multidrug efflux system)